MSDYNSGNIPARSKVEELFDSEGNSLGEYILENIDIQRPGNVVNRPNQRSGPNGWDLVDGQETGTAVIQLPTPTSDWPENGAYFEDDLGFGEERFVITNVGQAFAMDGYWKANVNLQKCHAQANSA